MVKKIKYWIFWGIAAGFIYGCIQSIVFISQQSYVQHRMFRLILREAAHRVGISILIGVGIFLAIFMLLQLLILLWNRKIKSVLEIRFRPDAKFFGFLQRSLLLCGLVYGGILVFQSFLFEQESLPSLKARDGLILGGLLLLYILLKWPKNIKPPSGKLISGTALSLASAVALLQIAAFLIQSIQPSGPNVLLILPDALRPDHLGCFGYPEQTSPAIDGFSTESINFSRAISNAPWTKPSMGTLFTSQYPYVHGALNWTDDLADRNLTLAEIFRNANYTTYGIQTNPAITKNHNFQQGFQHYHENIMGNAQQVADAFIKWQRHQKKPFFAYLHFMDTHVPYNSPAAFEEIFQLRENPNFRAGQFETLDVRMLTYLGLSDEDKQNIENLYDSAILYFDFHFARILEELRRTQELDNTIIVLLSDHGEEFWEHGGFAHGHSLYKEVLHVPLLIRYPPKLQPAQVNTFISSKDIYPTLVSLSGIKIPPNLAGKTLIPAIFNSTSMSYDPIFSEGIVLGQEKLSVIEEKKKLIQNTGLTYQSTLPLLGDLTKYVINNHKRSFELYHLDTDFKETSDVMAQQPELARALKNKLSAFSISHGLGKRGVFEDLNKKREDLKALGYIK